MGRKKAFDRSQAIDTVMQELWRNGYEACSVKSLSERLGITRSSFYNAFGSREELFFEALEHYFKQAPDRALEDIGPNQPILKSICKVFKSVCQIRADDQDHKGCLAVNSIVELVGNDGTLGPVLSQAVEKRVDRIRFILELAQQNGELQVANVNETAIALQNTLIGINVMSKVVHDEASLWQSSKSILTGLGIYQESFQL